MHGKLCTALDTHKKELVANGRISADKRADIGLTWPAGTTVPEVTRAPAATIAPDSTCTMVP
eukprot:1188167-Prorocentrum_minimum.AAC.4